MFIVQCQPDTPDGTTKITTATREAALEVANDFLILKMPFVTIIADGRLYTAEEFAPGGGNARTASLMRRTEGEVHRQGAELQRLEEMAGELMVIAFNLPPGVERRDSLMLIGSFRDRIAAMKPSELEATSTIRKARRRPRRV
jgi:hypothetical protein